MAALFGQIGEYVEGQEEWPQYVERLGHFLTANGIDNEARKKAVFLAVVGPKTYKLLGSLIAPAKPGEKMFAESVEVLTQHYSPAPSVIVQRYKFHTRFRQPGESIAVYVSELRVLAQTCNFGDVLPDMLRDRLVCGVNDDRIQRRLLSESTLTYERALELAQGLEVAARNIRELQGPQRGYLPAQGEVHKVSPRERGSDQRQSHPTTSCFRCGKQDHVAAECRFKDAQYRRCGKVGHLVRVCHSTPRKPKDQEKRRDAVKQVMGGSTAQDSDEYMLYQLTSNNSAKPFEVNLKLDGRPLTMEIDTGAAVTLVSESTYRRLELKPVQPTKVKLCTYAGEPLDVLGELEVEAELGDQREKLSMVVVKGEGASLLDRDWLSRLKLDWKEIHRVQEDSLQEVLDRHEALFRDELGRLKGYTAKIHVKSDATPRFCKARSVPYAMRAKVEEELNRLVQEGILEPVTFADWAAPIVPVLKSDKSSIRICGDFKLTVNQASKLECYPIPRIEDLLAQLSGGRAFTKLDMSQAYQQLVLDEESKAYVTINTQRGLFQYNRLPFGVSSAPAIFQRAMESLLSGIPGVVVYMDDILVTGKTNLEHVQTLEKVLSTLEEVGLRLRKDKCVFVAPSVVYLGYQVDAEGLHPVSEKVEAVQQAPAPHNVSALKSYLRLLSYYSRFQPNMSSTLAPLYRLLRKDVSWRRTKEEEKAFDDSKKLLTSSQVLIHFNPELDITLACDASAYGIGAVLSHRLPDGSEKPIGYASRTLTATERKYSHIEKEGLACVFGVKRFHSYVYGHHFTLYTDHQPLLALFKEDRAITPQASGRIKRWALTLSMYEYSLAFRSTSQHSNADAMSRLPLPVCPPSTPLPAELVLLVEHLQDSPVSSAQIRSWTRRDPLLSRVLRYVREGWPREGDPELRPFWSRKLELSVQDGTILWGSRVVVPPPGRASVLQELQGGHPGVSRMKSMARMFVWWPNMDRDIEDSVRGCTTCQQQQPAPPSVPLHPWKWPSRPWARIHMDLAGPFLGHLFLIVIDAHTKWIEAFPIPSASSSAVIQKLRSTFARFGLPETVVSDNGTCFTSVEFENFLRLNGIVHITSAPYHPASNGLVERAVQVFKQGLKKTTEGTLRISRFLFHYRMIPHSTTGSTPAELLMGRTLRTRIQVRQQQQKDYHDSRARPRTLIIGDAIFARNFGRGAQWVPGYIVQQTGPVSYKVELEGGAIWRRHQDHVRRRHSGDTGGQEAEDSTLVSTPGTDSNVSLPGEPTETQTSPPLAALPDTSAADPAEHAPGETSQSELTQSEGITPCAEPEDQLPVEKRYPSRQRCPPQRYDASAPV